MRAPKCAATSTHAVRKAPFIVVPRQDADEGLSSTWVWVTSNVELCGSWLKSETDTVGAL